MNDTDKLLAAAYSVIRAIEGRDRSALDRILAPEFVLQMPGSPDVGKGGFLDAVEAIPGRIEYVRGRDLRATLVAETGVVTGMQVAAVRLDGGAIVESRTAFADVFGRQGDGWQLVLAFSVDLGDAEVT